MSGVSGIPELPKWYVFVHFPGAHRFSIFSKMSVAFKRLLMYQGHIDKTGLCLSCAFPSYGTWGDLLQYKEVKLARWNCEPQGALFLLCRISSQPPSSPGQNPWMNLWDQKKGGGGVLTPAITHMNLVNIMLNEIGLSRKSQQGTAPPPRDARSSAVPARTARGGGSRSPGTISAWKGEDALEVDHGDDSTAV